MKQEGETLLGLYIYKFSEHKENATVAPNTTIYLYNSNWTSLIFGRHERARIYLKHMNWLAYFMLFSELSSFLAL